ncbi:methyltransferase domain-containing protein [Actinomadura barringtoniae]|uniref:Arsenite methyltransferase n=1 Tax=Actinomadura barringtoniae TaxID=1427535 RepID=A0A939T564_9ACTN|nr:methyltransferase domain-containing protein [Actinomadura barringtoniae]MBO2453381.1 methyltransferase domain-containing protein [Actinomadura barringtoniae]
MTNEAAFVQLTYDQLAQLGRSDLCCSPSDLYGPEELAALPKGVLSLSSGCGHPVEGADVRPGETVVDIGSGAGADCFLAGRLTGPAGRVVGVDPSPAMRARAEGHRDEVDMRWVSFVAGDASSLPLPDMFTDVVISNCVLSLAVDAAAAWREIARVLKPGGRFVVSDIVGGDPAAPPEEHLAAKARCESGLTWDEYRTILRGCGLHGLRLIRVGTATFRDGHRAQSVTIAGGDRTAGVHSVVLHHPGHGDAAAELAGLVAAACRDLDLRHTGYAHSRETAWSGRLIELLGGAGDAEDLTLVLNGAIALTAHATRLPPPQSIKEIVTEMSAR